MQESLSQSQFVNLVVTLWAIWYARRKSIHENEFQSPLSTHSFVQRFIADITEAKSCGIKPRVQTGARPMNSGWIAP
jgi:hypothetical protein